jgi:cell division septum initiation protein DivIVA
MPLNPKEINGRQLPVGVRGYRRDATDDLLKRVAWDYSQALHDHEALVEAARTLKQRNEELEAQVSALNALVARHTDRDEVNRALLANAQRAARELREAARVECEAMLKKARQRAADLERDAQLQLKTSAGEVERLVSLQDELQSRLRTSLESILESIHGRNGQAVQPELDGGLSADSLAPR